MPGQPDEELHVAFARLAGAKGAWNVEARAETNDQKRNAGATRLVQRQRVRLAMGVPGWLSAPTLMCRQYSAGRRPCTSSQIASLSGLLIGMERCPDDQLDITVESGPFVESDPVPADASEIGTTLAVREPRWRTGSPVLRRPGNSPSSCTSRSPSPVPPGCTKSCSSQGPEEAYMVQVHSRNAGKAGRARMERDPSREAGWWASSRSLPRGLPVVLTCWRRREASKGRSLGMSTVSSEGARYSEAVRTSGGKTRLLHRAWSRRSRG